jgi:hypothetical protein
MEGLSGAINDGPVKSEEAQASASAPEEALRRIRMAGSVPTVNSIWYASGADIKYFHYQSTVSCVNPRQVFMREHGGLAKCQSRRVASGA